MYNRNEHWVGTEKYHLPAQVTILLNHGIEININNGAIIMAHVINNEEETAEFYYDSYNGPKVNADILYIWNSKEKSKKGKEKKTFTITRKDLTELLFDYENIKIQVTEVKTI